MFVCIQSGVDDTSEQVVEDDGESLRVDHPVERTHEHGLQRVQPDSRATHEVRVGNGPGDYLHIE